MKTIHSLSQLPWLLAGSTPYMWHTSNLRDVRSYEAAEIPAVPAQVPGSVQAALLAAGVIRDWNQGNNYQLCEWVENRHWIYQTEIPAAWLKPGATVRLRALGLDDRGWILINGREVASFKGSFVPHVFDLSGLIPAQGGLLQIIFDIPPRWLGQFGYTSQMTDWRPRYNYTWDWTARLVQIGIWDGLTLEVVEGAELGEIRCETWLEEDGSARLRAWGCIPGLADEKVEVVLSGDEVSETHALAAADFQRDGLTLSGFKPRLWWPNGMGDQPLYTLQIRLVGKKGRLLDEVQRQVGFKTAQWKPCAGAVPHADPWILAVNGKEVFLQGFNWTPILPNFADVPESKYRALLTTYHDMGVNILRVWGGAFLEKEWFYRLCDELGILIWQEFPLSSSGIDNWPPEDETSIRDHGAIARSYIARRQHHVSLLCWCGGNELQGDLEGRKTGVGKPVDLSHPLIARQDEVVRAEDPRRRFMPTSSSGPRFSAAAHEFGKGVHWDVHGPWKPEGSLADWQTYWEGMDALFHAEVGAPGASAADLIERYSGGLPLTPGTYANPLWRRTLWWIEWPEFIREMKREPSSLQEFIDWSQKRQADALETVFRSARGRFPGCGGVIFWMGHDSYPVTANTSVIDFEGRLKPAGERLSRLFQQKQTVAKKKKGRER